jgi:peptide/nickel transport system substrate-binding protein
VSPSGAAPAPKGELNPFSILEIRQAMQYLANRPFVARDIYRGRAAPMISQVSPGDYDYLNVYDIERSSGIGYDPESGGSSSKAMQRPGPSSPAAPGPSADSPCA